MPYITQDRREDCFGSSFSDIETPGELNFAITSLCDEYSKRRGDRYFVYNEIIGALECAKQEFYRRIVAPYEDASITKNGDVYYDRNAVLRSETETRATAA